MEFRILNKTYLLKEDRYATTNTICLLLVEPKTDKVIYEITENLPLKDNLVCFRSEEENNFICIIINVLYNEGIIRRIDKDVSDIYTYNSINENKWKVVCIDNYDREWVNDEVVQTKLTYEEAELQCKQLNASALKNNADYYIVRHESVKDNIFEP